MIVVPLALYFANQGPGPVATPSLTTTSSARASGVKSEDHHLVAQHHRIRPGVSRRVGLAQLPQDLRQPSHRRLRAFEQQRHVSLRLVEVLGAVPGGEPEVGDPGKRRGDLDRHLAKMWRGTHAGTGLFHVVLTHGRLRKVSY